MRDLVSSMSNLYLEILQILSSPIHHLQPHPLPQCQALQEDYRPPITILPSFTSDLSSPMSLHSIYRLMFYSPHICASSMSISQIMLTSNRMCLNHILSHPNLELFPQRILLFLSML